MAKRGAYSTAPLSENPLVDIRAKPRTREEMCSLVEDSWDYLSATRLALEQRIKESIHFLAGDQWIRYLPHTRRYTRHSLDEWVPTPVTNYLVRTHDRILDIFTGGEARPVVDPVTQDLEDVDASLVAQRMLRSEFHRLRTDLNLHIPAATWLLTAGTVFLYAGWDAHAGDLITRPVMRTREQAVTLTGYLCKACGYQTRAPRPDMICPECGARIEQTRLYDLDSMGQPQMETIKEYALKEGKRQYRRVREGNLIESVVSPLSLFPMPAKSWADVRYCIEADPWDLDALRDKFGEAAEEVVAEDIEFEDWGGVYGHTLTSYFTAEKQRSRDRVLVKFFRHRPDNRWPKGLFIIYANGVILHSGDLDSLDGELPYVMIKYRDLPGQFWGGSLFTPLIPIQKRINSIDSHIIQNRKQMVSNQWLVPDGCGVGEISGRSGLVVRYNPQLSGGFKPERLQGVPVSQQVVNERKDAALDLQEVGGDKEAITGDIPPGPETGAAIEALQEQAMRRFSPMIQAWRGGLAEHEKRKLLIIDKYWREPRLVRTVGTNQELEAYYYSRADLTRCQDMTVRIGIGLNYSEAARRQTLLRLAQMGLLGDVRRPEVRGRLLEQLNVQGFEAEYVADAKKARRFLEKQKRGEAVPEPLPIDNAAIHYTIYREFMLTSEYEQLPQDAQQAIMDRVLIFQQRMQEEQRRAMMAAQAARGADSQTAQAVADTGATGQPVPVQQ